MPLALFHIIFFLLSLLGTVPPAFGRDMPDGGRVEASSTFHDFGRINEGEGEVSHVFYLRSADPVQVSMVRPSCSCIRVKYPVGEGIVPGKAYPVEVFFSPEGASGRVERNAEVFFGDGSSLVLSVGAEVTAPGERAPSLPYSLSTLRLSAPSMSLGFLFPGESREVYLHIKNTLPSTQSLRVIPSDPGSPFTVLCPSSLGGGDIGEILVSCSSSGGVDMKVTDSLIVYLGGKVLPGRIPVQAIFLSHPRGEKDCESPSLVVPSRITMKKGLFSRTPGAKVKVANQGGGALRILSVETSGGIEVSLEGEAMIPGGGALEMTVRGKGKGTVAIYSSDPSRPYKEIEINLQ